MHGSLPLAEEVSCPQGESLRLTLSSQPANTREPLEPWNLIQKLFQMLHPIRDWEKDIHLQRMRAGSSYPVMPWELVSHGNIIICSTGFRKTPQLTHSSRIWEMCLFDFRGREWLLQDALPRPWNIDVWFYISLYFEVTKSAVLTGRLLPAAWRGEGCTQMQMALMVPEVLVLNSAIEILGFNPSPTTWEHRFSKPKCALEVSLSSSLIFCRHIFGKLDNWVVWHFSSILPGSQLKALFCVVEQSSEFGVRLVWDPDSIPCQGVASGIMLKVQTCFLFCKMGTRLESCCEALNKMSDKQIAEHCSGYSKCSMNLHYCFSQGRHNAPQCFIAHLGNSKPHTVEKQPAWKTHRRQEPEAEGAICAHQKEGGQVLPVGGVGSMICCLCFSVDWRESRVAEPGPVPCVSKASSSRPIAFPWSAVGHPTGFSMEARMSDCAVSSHKFKSDRYKQNILWAWFFLPLKLKNIRDGRDLKESLAFSWGRRGKVTSWHSKLEEWQEWNMLVLAPSSVIFHIAFAQIIYMAILSENWMLEENCKRFAMRRPLPFWLCDLKGASRDAESIAEPGVRSCGPQACLCSSVTLRPWGNHFSSLALCILIFKSREMDWTL